MGYFFVRKKNTTRFNDSKHGYCKMPTYICVVKQRIRDQFSQIYQYQYKVTEIFIFKESFECVRYLEVLNSKVRIILCTRFRCIDHNLMIRKRRHFNIDLSLPLCQFCNSNVIEDVYLFHWYVHSIET